MLDDYYVGKIPVIKLKPEQQHETVGIADKILDLQIQGTGLITLKNKP